jgi:putative membrane protein
LRRGLLTARSLTLELRRLRGVQISEPLLLRLGGGARVKAIATGLGKAAEDETEDVAALAPPLPRPLACRLAAQIAGLDARPEAGARTAGHAGAPAFPIGGPDEGASCDAPALPTGGPDAGTSCDASRAGVEEVLGGGGLVAHPPAARRRRVVRALVTVAVLAAAAWAASSAAPWPWVRSWAWTVPAVALPVALWLAVESARNLGHALGARHLVTRSGAAARRTVALERAGISGWTITESFFQRRGGLVTISAVTAAGEGRYEVADVGRGDGLELAASAVPGLLGPFLDRPSRER